MYNRKFSNPQNKFSNFWYVFKIFGYLKQIFKNYIKFPKFCIFKNFNRNYHDEIIIANLRKFLAVLKTFKRFDKI